MREGRIVLAKGSWAIILVSIYLLTNQPHIRPDLSLGTLTLYLLITSTLTTTPLHRGNWWAYAFLHRLDGDDHVMGRWSVLRGEWGESGLGVMVDPSC